MRAILLFALLSTFSLPNFSQEKITFYSSDSLKLTADLYLTEYQNPFIILFHQLESSRGEYTSIAPKLMKLGYNCLAVDLRSGNKINYVQNESALRARKEKRNIKNIEALKDIEAAINYIKRFNQEPVILFGSSYSASLSLIAAKQLENIEAVVAFSPGEYFRPEFVVKKEIKGLDIPVFVCSTELEYKYSKELMADIDNPLKIVFKPANSRGIHGAKALWDESEGSKECWFQLAFFFGKLKEL